MTLVETDRARPGRFLRRGLVCGLLLLGTVPAGCSARRSAGAEPRESITVVVTNRSWAPVHVFVSRRQIRMGMVTTGRSVRLRIPPGAIGRGQGVVLGARPIGSRETVFTDALQVFEGQVIHWLITEPLSYSAITARVRDPGDDAGPRRRPTRKRHDHPGQARSTW